jgi:hypothetical protein
MYRLVRQLNSFLRHHCVAEDRRACKNQPTYCVVHYFAHCFATLLFQPPSEEDCKKKSDFASVEYLHFSDFLVTCPTSLPYHLHICRLRSLLFLKLPYPSNYHRNSLSIVVCRVVFCLTFGTPATHATRCQNFF